MKPNKNLLITATTYPRHKSDSIPDFVHSFAVYLSRQKWVGEVHVLVPHAENIATAEIIDGVRIHRYRYWLSQKGENITYGGGVGKIKRTPLYALKLVSLMLCQLLAAAKIIRREKIDSVNAHWLVPMGFLATLLKVFMRTPVVVTIHGGDVFSLKSGAMSRFKTWTLRHASAVVVNSSATQKKATKLFSGKKYPIIPMGVDIKNLQPLPKKPRVAGAPLRLLYVGRLAPEKGVRYLLDALQIAQKNDISVTLAIAGTGSEEKALKAQAKNLGISKNVTFLGWVPHAEYPKIFAKNDVFVGPSIIADNGWQEAFGLVFAESLALNTPVIATKTGGIPDIVTNGKNGILVPERDAKALAEAIKKLAGDHKYLEKLAKNSRAAVIKKFSWQQTIDRYEQVFANVLSPSKKS